MEFKVERATFADIYSLYECNKRNLPLFYSPDEYFFIMFSSNFDIMIIRDPKNNNKIIGYILGKIEKDNYHILSFGIDKEYRRNGLGSLLIKETIKKFTGKVQTISLYVHTENKTALQFYENTGFKIIKLMKDYYQGSLDSISQDAYFMQKRLN